MIYQRRAAPPITRKVEGDGHLRLDIDGSGQSSRLRDIGRRCAMQHVWCRVPPRAWPRHAKDTWLGLGLGLGLVLGLGLGLGSGVRVRVSKGLNQAFTLISF